jgi:pimeloyl-ACP methyl ester carboxylesterase
MDFMESTRGVKRFVLFGICAGADQALRTAVEDGRVVGAILLDGYAYPTAGNTFRYYLGRTTRLRTWWNVVSRQHPLFARKDRPAEQVAAPASGAPGQSGALLGLFVPPPRKQAEAWIRQVLDRGCKLQFLFTKSHRFSSLSQFGEMYPSLAKDTRLHLDLLTETDHVFTLRANQEIVMTAVDAWLRKTLLTP